MNCFFGKKGKEGTGYLYPFDRYDDLNRKIPDSELFPLFDVVSDYKENRFKDTRISKCIDQIYKERNSFEKDLPESIYLRTYDKRPDLFQAAIIGLPGTPYEHGIYVFDIKLPDKYPKRPPIVIYHFRGRKLNPSTMNSNGSFRNKKIFDKFDPDKSILMQVLFHIQQVVLNCKPYLKEPPLSRIYYHDIWIENSPYHLIPECTLPLHMYAYQSMVDILDNIPSLFRVLVCLHFSKRDDNICKAFDENVEHHMTYGQYRGESDFYLGKMRKDQCYALPIEFPTAKMVKLRVKLASVFAKNQANTQIAMLGPDYEDIEELHDIFGVPLFRKTLL